VQHRRGDKRALAWRSSVRGGTDLEQIRSDGVL